MDKLKPFCLFEFITKPAEITYEALPQNVKTCPTDRKYLIPYYPKALLLFPPIQSDNEQNSEIIHDDSDTSDMIQNDLYTSNDNSQFDDIVFDDDLFNHIDYNQSNMFDNELYCSASLIDDQYYLSAAKSDSEKIHYKPRS